MLYNQIDVTPILKEYGAKGAILIATGLALWRIVKWAGPRIDSWLEAKRMDKQAERDERRKDRERFVEMIDGNLKESQKDREEERDRFLGFVEGTLKQHTEALTTVAKKIDEKLR